MTGLALAIGDCSSAQLAAALAALERAMPTCHLPALPEATARDWSEAGPPELLVLLQSHSEQFSEAELLRLRQSMPLTPVVAVLGPWCDGETRSGRPLAAVRRIAWHEWPDRLERELLAWKQGTAGAWSQPATLSDEEWLLQPDATSLRNHESSRLIAIRSSNRPWSRCLADGLRRFGHSATVLVEREPTDIHRFAALVDDLILPADPCCLAPDYRAWQPRPIVALADFPRPHDFRIVQGLGAAMLMAKPLALDELAAQLERWLEASVAIGR